MTPTLPSSPDDSRFVIDDALARAFRRPPEEWEASVRILARLYPEHEELVHRRLRESMVATGHDTTDVSDESFFLDGLSLDPSAQVPSATEEFTFERRLGRGGMGIVYQAKHRTTGRRVAVKVVLPHLKFSETTLERFERETRLAASVAHPNCVFVYGAHRVEGAPAISMELCPGETLEDRLERDGRLPIEEAVARTIEVLEGLEAAHALGVVHRDIKPSNLFLTENGRIKIGDFGLARTLDTDLKLTHTGMFLGSPLYAAPEQIRGLDVDHRADIYSTAATLHALLTGSAPHQASSLGDLMARIATEPIPSLRQLRPQAPRGLETVLQRAMAKSPDERFASARDFRGALAPFAARSLSTAGVGLRIGAYIVDDLLLQGIIAVFSLGLAFAVHFEVVDETTFDRGTPLGLLKVLGAAALVIAYFTVMARQFQGSIGKRLFGLRVLRVDGRRLSWNEATRRSVVFGADAVLRPIVNLVIPGSIVAVAWLTLFLTMRRRNGYRGVHEFLSNSRVMETRPPIARQRTRAVRHDPVRTRPENAPATLGDFAVDALIGDTTTGPLYLAQDEVLDRTVWIHRTSESNGHPDLDVDGNDEGVRWIARHELGEDDVIDVYEAIGGASLLEYEQAGARLDWARARRALIELATHIEGNDDRKRDDGRLARHGPLSPGRVWIDRDGLLRLLAFDFCHDDSTDDATTTNSPLFVRAARILIGPKRTPDMPAGADDIIRDITRGHTTTPAAFRMALESVDDAPSDLRTGIRASQLFLASLWVAVVTAMATTIAVDWKDFRGLPASWQEWVETYPEIWVAAVVTSFVVIPTALLAFGLHGGVWFRLFRINIVDRDGRLASRTQCAARAVLAYLPSLLLLVIACALRLGGRESFATAALVGSAVVFLAGGVIAFMFPSESLQDRCVKTHLVR